MVSPAVIVWLGVAELTEKSWITVSGSWSVWLCPPDASATVRLTVYAAGAAVLGTFSATDSVTAVFALIASGFGGVTTHCAPGIELASQLALMEPL